MAHFIRSFISPGPQLCENCGLQPKFGGFDYCGKTCATEADKRKKAGGGRPGANRGGGAPSSAAYSRNGSTSVSGSYSSAAAGPNFGVDPMMCEQCGTRPKNQERQADGRTLVHPFCGRNCADAASRQKGPAQSYGQGPAGGASATTRVMMLDSSLAVAGHIYEKFRQRWDSEDTPEPAVISIYRIHLPPKVYNRFDNALEMNEGAQVCTTYYGGQSICEIGCKGEPEAGLCTWESCSICVVLRNAFNTLEFGDDAYDGMYGAGIYTHESPAMAHRWTLAKNPEITSFRAIIQCRVVRGTDSEPGQPHAGFFDETGRVFCKDKRAIIPTHLIIYDPTPRAAPGRGSHNRP